MRKKHIIIFIAALCMLVVASMALAACNKDRTDYYEVTLSFDDTQGSVALSAPADGNTGNAYAKGETVTVTVTPNAGMVINSFTVSGIADAALTDGQYTFEVVATTEVTVTFAKDMDGILSSLQGSVVFEGTSTKKSTYPFADPVSQTLKTTYDAAKKAVMQEVYDGGIPQSVVLFQQEENNAGKVSEEGGAGYVQIAHDMLGNVQKTPVEGGDFSLIFNPFDGLTEADLQYLGNNEWTLPSDKLNAVTTTLCGAHDEEVQNFKMTEENGKITKITYNFPSEPVSGTGYEETVFFDITVKEAGTASIGADYFDDYQFTNAHSALKYALDGAALATAYTVHYTYGNDDYNIYYTQNNIFATDPERSFGYAARPDGNAWQFFQYGSTGDVRFSDVVADDYASLKASFSLVDSADNENALFSLLADNGNGTFSLRLIDNLSTYSIEETSSDPVSATFAAFFAKRFATGAKLINNIEVNMDNIYNFSVSLKDNKLHEASFYIGENLVTLTFSGWNEPTSAIEIPQETIDGAINSAYCGTWVSVDNTDESEPETETDAENADETSEEEAEGSGKIILTITLDGLTLVDEDAGLVGTELVENLTEANGGYMFRINNNPYTIILNVDGTMTLSSNLKTVTLHKSVQA